MAKLMGPNDPFIRALMDALGLPPHTRSFELRSAVGEAVTVRCEYFPSADTVVAFDPQPLLAKYQLTVRDAAPRPAMNQSKSPGTAMAAGVVLIVPLLVLLAACWAAR